MLIVSVLDDLNPWWRNRSAAPGNVPPVRRFLEREVLARLLGDAGRRATVVYGPRQVGKSVLLLQVAEDLLAQGCDAHRIVYFDFSDDRLGTKRLSLRDVASFEGLPGPTGKTRFFLLDEVEHASDWAGALKHLVDGTRDRFLTTSSSSGHLRQKGRESGPGRWDELLIEPMSLGDYLRVYTGRNDVGSHQVMSLLLSAPEALERYIAGGGFPEFVGKDLPESRRRLRDDIAERAILRDLLRSGADVDRVRDLFLYAVQHSGAIQDPSRIQRDLGADRRTVAEWKRLLFDTCLLVPLEPFTSIGRRRLRSHPKVYAADPGLISAFSPLPSPHRDGDVRGRLFEAAAFRHLRELPDCTASFYRDARGEVEVDFVVSGPLGTAVVEVTSSASPLQEQKTLSLDRVAGKVGAASRCVVYGGREEWRGGIHFLPVEKLLLEPAAVFETHQEERHE